MKKKSRLKENLAEQNNGIQSGHGSEWTHESQATLRLFLIASQTNLSSLLPKLLKQILVKPNDAFYLSSRDMGRFCSVAKDSQNLELNSSPKFAST